MNTEIGKIKELRDATGASLALCREALAVSGGDISKARAHVDRLLAERAEKKIDGKTGAGVVASYIHHDGRIGVLVEVRAQTDFVTRNDEFKKLAHEIALQIAATDPKYLSPQEIPEEEIARRREAFSADLSGKADDMKEKIVLGRLQKWYQEVCLINQKYFRDEDQTIEMLIKGLIGKVGENISIARFARFSA